ncbi:MAG TPA: hypothetical protein VFS30_11565 [Dehalococcoidia bacterium]|nr:hypothetical protein [Dehalococcoidia bacterium]
MSGNQKPDRKKKTEKGSEIPIPTREEVDDALKKMANSKQPSTPTR